MKLRTGLSCLLAILLGLGVILMACGQPPPSLPSTVSSAGKTALPVALPTPMVSLEAPDPAAIQQARQLLAGMSVDQKIGQVMLIGLNGLEASAAACEAVTAIQPGGVFYMPYNMDNPDQVRRLSAGLQECAGKAGAPPLLAAAEAEGEAALRYRSGASVFPAELALAAANDLGLTRAVYQSAGQELAYGGVNLVFSPVADILANPDNRLMALRTFGSDPGAAARHTAAAVQGLLQAGTIPVIKHFPGHGGSDARYAARALPVDPISEADLNQRYLPSFQAGVQAGAPAVMTSHVAFPTVTGEQTPTSISPKMIARLRATLRTGEAGFNGVVVSEAIMAQEGITGEATALNLSAPEAALLALQAGTDLLLLPEADQAHPIYTRLLQAARSGDLPAARLDEAALQVLTLKAAYRISASAAPAPDWQADQRLALEAGKRAVTIYRDQDHLIPIPSRIKRALVIGPKADWSLYPALKNALAKHGVQTDFVYYSAPWEGVIDERQYVQTLPKQADDYDLTIFFTWQAHIESLAKDAWQVRLGGKLTRRAKPTLVVALRSPTDLFDLPDARAFIGTHGATEGQFAGLVDILTGARPASGVNPLPEMLKP
jgi:beta-N-acetylhexosaminidase